jgi:hypothetical protein
MPDEMKQDPVANIRRILKGINQAWIEGRWSELEGYFHDDMVIAQPGQGRQGTGKQACVDSYKSFADRAVVREFEESEHQIDIWGETAVASYRVDIIYEMNGQEHRDSGIDLYVFIQQYGRWLAVWRTIIPRSAEK